MMVLSLFNVKPIRFFKNLDAHYSGEKNNKMSHVIDGKRKFRHRVCLKREFGIPGKTMSPFRLWASGLE